VQCKEESYTGILSTRLLVMDLVSALTSLDRFFWNYRRETVTKNCLPPPICISVLIKSNVSDLVITLVSGHLISPIRDNHKIYLTKRHIY